MQKSFMEKLFDVLESTGESDNWEMLKQKEQVNSRK